MTATSPKIKRECLHPAEIPPDPKEKRTAEQKVETFFVVSFFVVVPICFLTLFLCVAYDMGEQKGYRRGWSLNLDEERRDTIRDCKVYGVDRNCSSKYYGWMTGEDETW